MQKNTAQTSGSESLHQVPLMASANRLCLRKHRPDKAQVTALVKNYLYRNLERDPGLNEMAEAFYVSPRTLTRRFRKAGVSYRSMVNEVKKETAMALLCEQDIPVADIARRLGYTDPSNFTKAFKLWVGQCPRAYRSSQVVSENSQVR